MKIFTSRSKERPVEWDIQSSPTTVYHNYNVFKKVDADGTDFFEYTTGKMTHQEYNLTLVKRIEEQQAIIDSLVVANLEVN